MTDIRARHRFLEKFRLKSALSAVLFLVLGMANAQDVTRKLQMQYPRVKEAFSEKWDALKKDIQNMGMETSGFNVLLCGFKAEKKLEVYLSSKGERTFRHFKTYDFCTLSGELGPKRKQGDYQIPEGFYHIDRFNPSSNFHLSLGINYPNASDKLLSDKKSPGGDIFIHGNCVSVGCVPITDDLIKELYVLCVEAAEGGQKKIPVYLFPARMTETAMESIRKMYRHNAGLLDFWNNLKEGYDLWEKYKQPLKWKVNEKGKYLFQ